MAEGWIERLAATLGVATPSEADQETLLDVSRDVAHGVERKVTPIAAFVLGTAVGARVAAGQDRERALTDAISALRATLPTGEPGGG